MKSKKVLSFLLTFGIVLIFSVSALAMSGGAPAAHDLTGEEFGAAVSALAQSEPGAVAAHVANKPVVPNGNTEETEAEETETEESEAEESEMAGGMPAAHGLTGKEFGAAVSALAQSEPGAVAAHVANKPALPNGNSEENETEEIEAEETEAEESEMAGGMPAAHDLTGEDFGAAVGALAQSEPGAVAAHVRGE